MKTALLSVLSLLTVTGVTAEPVLLPPTTLPAMSAGRNAPYVTDSESRQALRLLGQMIALMNPGALEQPLILVVPDAASIVAGKNLPITLRPLIVAACTAVGLPVRVVNKADAVRMMEVAERNVGLPSTPSFNRDFLGRQGSFFTITGVINRYDEAIDTQRRNFVINLLIGVKWAFQVEPSAEFERCSEITELGMEFQLEDQNGFQMPNSQTEVITLLGKRNKRDRVGLLAYGSGAQYTAERGQTEGVSGACIRAADHATLVLLGKLFHVPYWRCVRGGGEKDEVVMDFIKQEFHSMSETNRIWVTQRYLRLCGQQVVETGVLDDATRQALVSFAQQRGLPPAGCLTPELYAELHLAMPMPFPTYELARHAITISAAGPTVQFDGFKLEDSNRFFSLLEKSKVAVRVERDSVNLLKFRVVDYREKTDTLARYIHGSVPKLGPEYKDISVCIENERCIRVSLAPRLVARK